MAATIFTGDAVRMDAGFILRDIYPRTESGRKLLADFLSLHGLRCEADLEYAVGAFDAQDDLVACGACAGPVLKDFAVSEQARGHNILGAIISRIVKWEFARGVTRLFVYTRPRNTVFFEQCGFHTVAETPDAALLENRPNGIEDYFQRIKAARKAGSASGCIVMNCNPFTLGHRYIIEQASSACDVLNIFLVEEDASEFPFAVRKRLLQAGTGDLAKVRIYDSGPYIISSATFPAYFLKRDEDVSAISSALDLTLFAKRIAPYFSIKRRFVGEEPYCPVTRKYNESMLRILPENGVEVTVIPRLAANGKAISASRVRQIIREYGVDPALRNMIPEGTWDYLRSEEARELVDAIRRGGGSPACL